MPTAFTQVTVPERCFSLYRKEKFAADYIKWKKIKWPSLKWEQSIKMSVAFKLNIYHYSFSAVGTL